MELLGLIWAASLPHQNAALRMSQALSMPEADHGSEHVQGQPHPVELNPIAPEWQGLHLPLGTPHGFQPQLRWQATPALNWEQWAVTAKVAVIPEGATIQNSTHKTEAGTSSPAAKALMATCPASEDDITQLLVNQQADSAQQGYSIRVNSVTIGTLPDREAAETVATQLRETISTVEEHPSELQPQIGDNRASAQVKGKIVFALTDERLPDGDFSAAETAVAWVNNLRHLFGASILDLGTSQMVAQGLGETDQVISGTASWYGPYFHGRTTATGEIFDQHELTAAHRTLPFGTVLKVRNLLNNKSVVVRINDRGPYIGDRSLDLSYAAAQCLDSEVVGVIPYEATILEPGVPRAWRAGESLTAQE